jgi:hypothetical protein
LPEVKTSEDDFDLFTIYCPDNDKIDILPMLGKLVEVQHHIEQTGNNQNRNRAGLASLNSMPI